ncbi:DUF6318 family protein [Knoellia sp. GCM10027112]|uniref:DUF6318 family protein n=1 Tax=Knoellia sp. GCM10027112 TaxID=3273395 RepID=UPI003607AFDA
MGRVLAGYARATVFGVGVAAALALAGCSDGAGAQTGPASSGPSSSATTSATVSSSATTSPPSPTVAVSIPAAARQHTEEGAKAFAEFYTLEMDRATVSADATRLKSLSLPSCTACKGVTDVVEGYRSRGERQEKPSVVVDLVQVRSYSETGAWIEVLVEEKAHRVVNRSGQVISTSQGTRINFRHKVTWVNGTWMVADSEIIQ